MLNGLKNKTFVQPTVRNTSRGSGAICDEIFILIHYQGYLQQQVKKNAMGGMKEEGRFAEGSLRSSH